VGFRLLWIRSMANRSKRRSSGRKWNTRKPRQLILIVCEGEKTEPNYFKAFRKEARAANIQIEVEGTGSNTFSLVQKKAQHICDELRKEGVEFDQVWCVFDKDDFPDNNVKKAFALAKKSDFQIAYSNESFGLWYLLHYDFITAGLSRDLLCTKLTERLGQSYRKNDEAMYETLLSRQATAIQNAKRLLLSYNNSCLEKPCLNPSTTVVFLVESLNKEINR